MAVRRSEYCIERVVQSTRGGTADGLSSKPSQANCP
jgi:hypothetical protein